jgi:hypothetical protein
MPLRKSYLRNNFLTIYFQVSDDDNEFPLAIAIACSMFGLALLVILIFCIIWKCNVYPKTKTAGKKDLSALYN